MLFFVCFLTKTEPASSLCHLCNYEFSGPGQLAIHLRYVHQQIAQLSPRGKKGPGEVEGQRSDLDEEQDGEVEEAEGEGELMNRDSENHIQDVHHRYVKDLFEWFQNFV